MGELVPKKATLNLAEAAEVFHVHVSTVRRWIDEGVLHEAPLPRGKHRKIPRPEVIRLLEVSKR